MTTITATPNTPDPPWPASDGTAGVYGITVAADLAGMSVQALRLYERKGLLQPVRTPGGTRRYSDNDITRLRRIADLIAEGVNLDRHRPHPRPGSRQHRPARPQHRPARTQHRAAHRQHRPHRPQPPTPQHPPRPPPPRPGIDGPTGHAPVDGQGS